MAIEVFNQNRVCSNSRVSSSNSLLLFCPISLICTVIKYAIYHRLHASCDIKQVHVPPLHNIIMDCCCLFS